MLYSTDILINKTISFIETFIENGERVDLEKISHYTGYSKRHIQRIFKSKTGKPLGKYILHRRLTWAALLLKFTRKEFNVIAYDLYFDSQQSFNREFKKYFGITPSKYRSGSEWLTHPLLGRGHAITIENNIEPVYMEQGYIFGREFKYSRFISNRETTQSYEKYLDFVFNSVSSLKEKEELWVVSRLNKEQPRDDRYYATSCVGKVDGKGVKSKYNSGIYIKTVFETSRSSHTNKINNNYLNVFPGVYADVMTGCDVEVFFKDNNTIKCKHFMPSKD
ncbi:TPA: helix-turn-helix transcriptional regulator [Escherichia coli]|nr:helix-turn-helix transcriptional regulator [Escherichia coli]